MFLPSTTPITMSVANDEKTPKKLVKLVDDGNTNNYNSFVINAKLKLTELGLWKYIEGPESIPPVVPDLVPTRQVQGTDPATGNVQVINVAGNEGAVLRGRRALEPWKAGDGITRCLIYEALPDDQIEIVKDATTAKEAWEALKDEYRPVNALRAQILVQQIMSFKADSIANVNVTKWANKMRSLYKQLSNQDNTRITDLDFARALLSLVPTSDAWATFSERMQEQMTAADKAGKPLRSSYIIQKIKEHDWS